MISRLTLLLGILLKMSSLFVDCAPNNNKMRVIHHDPIIFNLEIPPTFPFSREQVRFLSRLYSFSKDVSSQNSSNEYHFTFLLRAALRDYRLVERLWQESASKRKGGVVVVEVEDLAERVFNELFLQNPQEARRSLEIMDYVIDDIVERNLSYKATIMKYIQDNMMGTKNVLSVDNFLRVLRVLQNRPEISGQLPSMHRTVLCDILPTPGESEPKWALFWVAFGNYFNRSVYKNRNSVFFWESLAFSAVTDFARHFPQERFTIFGGSPTALLDEIGHVIVDEFRETSGEPPVDHFKQAATCGHTPTLVHLLKSREGQILHQNRANLCLFHALDNGNVETAEFLLKSGLKFSQSQIEEIFRIARSVGYTKFLAFKLKKDSVGVQSRRPKDVFLDAIRNGNIDVIDSVISAAAGGALTFSEPVLQDAILEAIHSKNNLQIVNHLCRSSLKFSQNTINKALQAANELGNPELIRYLSGQSNSTIEYNEDL